ncbi:MAG: bifunctional diaminohydroxyphosphoribosylaminopyrimidine deaminase/5-amino-6-(5-phosphoribosylamino)uracil reductase RibD [Acidobacteria bacterium]|nr:bifunctional diaminohydroxyphosphoribosylaminopyrimidine deaminase/5-amino-6-(5-phosphoribosylamino)uracil reductase RibD [Acidobacteriota bacterium]
MRSSAESRRHLGRALALAARGRYRTSPNPRVGAVLVRDGNVVGEGWHHEVGGPHAEIHALAAAGEAARDATLYVTLEPCSHHGRTPPCADAVIAAGVRRVVACHRDPNPQVAGRGFAALAAAGIEVEVGPLAEQAVRLNLGFVTSHALGRPAVTLKWAMSLDGKIATARGESQWISSPKGRQWALELREEHDAILVGSGTALADDPRLDRRLGLAAGPIVRVVLDRRLRLPATARALTVPGPLLVYTEAPSEGALERFAGAVAEVETVSLTAVTPTSVTCDLHRRGVQSLLVEGGGEVLAEFVRSGTFDRVLVDCAPRLIGGEHAPGPLRGAGAGRLAEAPRLRFEPPRRRGGDLILEGFREGCLPDLLRRLDG